MIDPIYRIIIYYMNVSEPEAKFLVKHVASEKNRTGKEILNP